ncbi:asparaginase [Nocardioides sp. CER19]|uniref:asparaginase n=1 Tax=Nocardioides sp. CER19 TaxID=3038538 RepID=UPI00244A7E33|nr:asparaginase [Nocardioides sp. CER19]MDH2413354.1 asparaginase [Nocardioides sp. CER19]
MSVPVTEIVRSGFVEGRHHGSVVALDADGTVAWSVGDVTSQILPRSTNKPLQAVGMVGLGLDLPPRLLALAAASHSGEEIHLAGVREILAGAGLTEQALGNIPDLPLDPIVRDQWLRDGREPSKLVQNCSGKHAAMIATCVARDWQLSGYFEPDHPLQQLIQRRFEHLTGEPAVVTIDGCGAPLLSSSLTGLARAFRTLALATEGPERRVADAIREFPEYVSGSNRDELRLLRALPGAIGKLGAEAVYAVALPDGRTVALKIEDGGDRARPVVMAEALRRLGVESAEVDAIGTHTLLGGGMPVGEIRAAF